MLLFQFRFDIYSALIEKNNLYFYVVWFIQPAVFDSYIHCKSLCKIQTLLGVATIYLTTKE